MKFHKLIFGLTLSAIFLVTGFSTQKATQIFAQDGVEKTESGAKITAGNQEIETPIFGVRFIEKDCTNFIADDVEAKIKLAFQVVVRPKNFANMVLELLATEVSQNSRRMMLPIEISFKEGVVDYFYFIPSEFSAKYFFKMRLSIRSDLAEPPAYSQIFVCEVDREAVSEKVPQTRPDTHNEKYPELKINGSKLTHSIEQEPKTKCEFYKMKIDLLLEISNPLLPIIWDRTVNYKYNPLMSRYFKGAFAPPKTDLTQHLREIYALPPNDIFKLLLSVEFCYFDELFPLIYKQTDDLEMNYELYRITTLFTVTNKDKFPPEITCKLDIPEAESQIFKIR